MKLALGVVEIPYVTTLAPQQKRAARWRHSKKPWQSLAATISTGDVATILESKYSLFQTFYDLHQQDIARELENKAHGALQSALMGAPATFDPFADLSNIEQMFRDAIDHREFDERIPGVPTQASLMGVNRRLKSGKGSARASFFDTGTLRSSLKVWLER